jgi:hypothetical protein
MRHWQEWLDLVSRFDKHDREWARAVAYSDDAGPAVHDAHVCIQGIELNARFERGDGQRDVSKSNIGHE